jgi:hypothetical protein
MYCGNVIVVSEYHGGVVDVSLNCFSGLLVLRKCS